MKRRPHDTPLWHRSPPVRTVKRQRPTRRQRANRRRAISLLEVILALSILGVSTAILAQIVNQAADNAIRSQDIVQAQLVCDSKLSEYVTGLQPIQAQSWSPVSLDTFNQQWFAMTEILPSEQQGMITVAVTAANNIDPTFPDIVRFRLVRSLIDPNLGLDVPQEESDSASTSSTAGGAG